MKPFDKLLLGLGLLTTLVLVIVFLPKLNSGLATSLGSGVATFFNGLWIAVIVLFWVLVGLGIVYAFFHFKRMSRTQMIVDPKDGRQVRAVIHKDQIVQLPQGGMDLAEMMKLQQQQAVQMQTYWKMLNTATTSMKNMAAYLEQLEVVDADDYDGDEGEEDGQIDPARLPIGTQPAKLLLPQGGSVADSCAKLLTSVLDAFQIHAYVEPSATMVGPRVILFGVVPTGVQGRRTRIEEFKKREKDIQLALGAKSIRLLTPIPGTHYVGIEIPNPAPTVVEIADVLESSEYQQACATSKLVVALGCDVSGRVRFCDIEKAPHILIGGTTNAGKSVLINVLIASLLNNATPKDVRMIMVDPKQVELAPYNGIAHLLRPVITDMTQVVPMLKRVIDEMERRYRIFVELGVRKLSEYREAQLRRRGLENLPSWVIIIDEFAELMMTTPEETEEQVTRLAQKARATGIHLIIATQKPLAEVVTSLIKGNLPTKIALQTANGSDSRVILDTVGAEKLLGNGDMLYRAADSNELIRIQGAYMTNDQIQSVIARALGGVQSPPVIGEPSDKVVYLPSRIASQGKADGVHPVSPRSEGDAGLSGESGSQVGPNQMETASGNQIESPPQALVASLDGERWQIEQAEWKIERILAMLDATQEDQFNAIWQVVPGKGQKYKKARAERVAIYRYIQSSLRTMSTWVDNSQAGEA